MGFAEPVMRKLNKKLIYVSISGFGEDGPYAHKRVYDPVIQALSCATDIRLTAQRAATMFRIIIADKVTAITAAQAISTALYAREKRVKDSTFARLCLTLRRACSGRKPWRG